MPDAITIPGATAWSLLHKEHGYMPWKDLFSPAINFATQGIKVHERVALDWSKYEQKLSLDSDTSKIFLKNGKSFKFWIILRMRIYQKLFRQCTQEGRNGFIMVGSLMTC